MHLQLITPEKILFSGEVELATIPGTEGDFGVMTGHAPFISTLREGTITLALPGGEQRTVAVKGGIAEIVPERGTLLIEQA